MPPLFCVSGSGTSASHRSGLTGRSFVQGHFSESSAATAGQGLGQCHFSAREWPPTAAPARNKKGNSLSLPQDEGSYRNRLDTWPETLLAIDNPGCLPYHREMAKLPVIQVIGLCFPGALENSIVSPRLPTRQLSPRNNANHARDRARPIAFPRIR